SIELRSPFLDYEFVNFALSIPGSMKVKNNEPKYILKKSLEAILPDEVLYRKKMGFCLPLKQWGGEIMIDYVESNYVEFCKNFNLLNQDGIKQILNNVKGGNERSVNDLWTAYFLISWFKRWMHA
ncbi:MAG TPA: asparagine synthase-related protein, partial [Bacteroidia bacterium]|nr:asparagine synthase-related protein [Bacteroidia bacterium]